MSSILTKLRPEIDVASYKRIDGFERVSGKANFCADWRLPGMLYGSIITSNIPNGTVTRIDTESILAKEGVEAVVTCFDDSTNWSAGERLHERKLFTINPKFLGDCIGAVAAKTRDTAQEASAQAQVTYEELPSVFNLEDALKLDAPKVWPDGNESVITYCYGDIDRAFRESNESFERTYKTSRVHPASIETIASLAWWEDAGRKLVVVAETQAIHNCRDGLAEDLGIPIENVRVICKYKGGGFGNRSGVMNYDLIAAILSKKTGKPVMLEYTREQDFVGLHTRWPTNMQLKVGVNTKDGRLLALKLNGYVGLGAYTRRPKQLPNFLGTSAVSYFSAMLTEEHTVYTNTPTTGNVRSPAGIQAIFAVETMIDEIAFSLKMNPLDFRVRNVRARFPELKEHFTSCGLLDCFEIGSEMFDWNRRWRTPPSRAEFRSNKEKWSGIGVAMSNWHASLGKGEARVSIQKDGKVKVSIGVVDIGTGAKTTMAALASETLGVPIDEIEVIWGDTDMTPPTPGESGSKTTAIVGTAVTEACRKLNDRLARISDPKEDRNAQKLQEIMKKYGQELEEYAITDPHLPNGKKRDSFGVHFVQVDVDIETGAVSIEKYLAIHDSGRIVNHLTAASQVKGSVMMGIGMALTEELRVNPDYGSFLNSNMMNYKITTHSMAPNVEVKFIEIDDPYGPKSLGEIALPASLPAIGNAIFNATGIRLREIPFTPDRILLADS